MYVNSNWFLLWEIYCLLICSIRCKGIGLNADEMKQISQTLNNDASDELCLYCTFWFFRNSELVTSLRKLPTGNNLGTEGMKYLSEALKQNTTLSKLNLSCTYFALNFDKNWIRYNKQRFFVFSAFSSQSLQTERLTKEWNIWAKL